MTNKQLLSALFIALGLLITSSCVKKTFDDPPDASSYDPKLTVTNTVWQLKQLYYSNGNSPLQIVDDMTISGLVVADDRSGNFYKQIVVQDSTSGITVLLNRSIGLYNDFPIGRKVYIKCKGLWIGAYGNFIQLGGGFDAIGNSLFEIPSNVIDRYIVKANYPNVIKPLQVSISQIAFSNTSQTSQQRQWLGSLIQLDSVEFVAAEVGQDYAQDPNISSGTDRNIQDCSGAKIVMRNSGYSRFRTAKIPSGRGKLVGIYSTYETGTKKTPQLLIRDTMDVTFTAPRCGGVIIAPASNITIDSLRKLYPGTDTNQTIIVGNHILRAVVTSSIQDSSLSKFSCLVQDASGRGIVLYYSNGYTYKMGDSLTININAAKLLYYRGTLELEVSTAKTTKGSSGNIITPVVVNINDLNADLNKPIFNQRVYESVLVKINGCTIAGTPTTYSGDKTITDGTGNLIMYTRFSASHAGLSCPTTPVSITGNAIKFYSKNEIQPRNSADIQ